jgi:hypothetical protein
MGPVFSNNMEMDLIEYLLTMEQYVLCFKRQDATMMTFQLAENNNLKMSLSETKRICWERSAEIFSDCQSHIISMDRAERLNRTAVNGFFDIPQAELQKAIIIPTESSIYSKLDSQLFRKNLQKFLH